MAVFSLRALVASSERHLRNMPMYSAPLLRTFPALLGVPPLLVNGMPFVSERDQTMRRTDVTTFFSAATSQLERRELLRKYGVSFVLAPRSAAADSATVSESALRALGSVAHVDDHFLLLRVDSAVRRSP